jgi:hypothetical protein
VAPRRCTCSQLRAGVRVLDIRLAVNPWLAADTRNVSAARAAPPSHSSVHTTQQQQQHHQQQQQRRLAFSGGSSGGGGGGVLRHAQHPFSLEPATLEGRWDWAAAGGPLSAQELGGALVTSHSLPGAPLREVLRDVRAFLADFPGEVRRCGAMWRVWARACVRACASEQASSTKQQQWWACGTCRPCRATHHPAPP